jgi:hypothetical protein
MPVTSVVTAATQGKDEEKQESEARSQEPEEKKIRRMRFQPYILAPGS